MNSAATGRCHSSHAHQLREATSIRQVLPPLAVSSAVTFAVMPVVRKLMIRFGTMDVPNARSSHKAPIPRGGGLGVLTGIMAAALVGGKPARSRGVSSALALGLVGYADDTRGGLSPVLRLIAQVLAATTTAGGGSALTHLTAILAVPSVVNVVNFMDGINGMTSLTCCVWGINAMTMQDATIRWLGAATAGAGVGFLPWNAPHARVFLGDVGSYLIGGMLAAGIVQATKSESPTVTAAQTGSPLLPYAVDAAQAIIRRRRDGEKLTEAHRQHVYQRVVDSGRLTHLEMALVHAGFATCCATAWRLLPTIPAVLASAAVCAAYLRLPKARGEQL